MRTQAFFIGLLLSAATGAVASSPEDSTTRNIADTIRLQSDGKIRIYMDPAIERISLRDTVHADRSSLTTETEDGTREKKVVFRAGYRIQVYSDNKRQTAKRRAQRIASEISGAYPDYGSYLAYKAPYWRLRVGDFVSEEEAKEALLELKSKFPSLANEMRIVRDRIKHLE